ncbi:Metalloendopeptidase [Trichostrongylus colubriformis]|uniref:Metalloendopeptidase n=1 Tax=Trichostrongylus colubriformis TaxID=6319 RepID=A0AAN8IBN5_TRICO
MIFILLILQLWSRGPPPPENVWRRRARRFCRRFPGHPKCRGGRTPMFEEITTIINTVVREGGKFLPRVPKLFIKDPLAGINPELVNAVRSFTHQLGMLNPEIGNTIRDVCRNIRCMEQDQEQLTMKETVVKKVYDFEKAITGKDNTDKINFRLDRTMQVKQALLERANLSNTVTAADNGVFDKDVLLTEKQANFLLNELGKAGEGIDVPPPGDGTTKYKTEFDRNDIRNALKEIEEKTCIRFEYVPTPPMGYHINYQKVDSPTFCGLSYIGRVEPANPIYLSFQCGNSKGIAMHETLHTLGLNHEHLRSDRDQHVTVDWSNINPQHYDYFAIADSKLYTTYGIKYDYGSIMHYNAYMGALNVGKPTIIPKVDKDRNIGLLGQREKLSDADVQVLKKMYCMPGCDDTNVYCGVWALKELCNHPNHKGWMEKNCQKSCNFCIYSHRL